MISNQVKLSAFTFNEWCLLINCPFVFHHLSMWSFPFLSTFQLKFNPNRWPKFEVFPSVLITCKRGTRLLFCVSFSSCCYFQSLHWQCNSCFNEFLSSYWASYNSLTMKIIDFYNFFFHSHRLRRKRNMITFFFSLTNFIFRCWSNEMMNVKGWKKMKQKHFNLSEWGW